MKLRPLAPISLYRGWRRGPHWRVYFRRSGDVHEFPTFTEAHRFVLDVLAGRLRDVRW